jgi:hypothetical protein
VRDTTVEGELETIIFDLKVPRHCPLVLATCSSAYSTVRSSHEVHSVSIK